MNPKQTAPPPPGITLGDVYYILFRHKWLIAILSAVTVAATLLVRGFWPVPYESEARLMIKYVHENKPPEQIGPDSQSSSGDVHGETVINSEIEILTSLDLANNVVEILGPARILAKAGGGTNRIEAANLIRKGLVPTSSKSDVIELTFTHPDPDMVQPILSQLIEAYLNKHREVHQPAFNDFLQKQKEEVQGRIGEMDKQLQELKQQANITSINDSEKSSSDLLAKILSEKWEAEAEYASYQVTIQEMQKSLPQPAIATASTNAAASSNNLVPIPPDKVSEYQRICQQLSGLQSQEEELLLSGYTTNTSLVRTKEAQVGRAETLKKQLEDKYPGLIAMKPVETKGTTAAVPAVDPRIALREEITKAEALAARIQTLSNQMALVQAKTATISGFEGRISQLQRDKEIAEGEFAFYSRKLEEARVNEAVGPGNSNISQVEAPTPPARILNKFNKIIAGIFFGGLAVAFALPFVIELYLDRSLKRPLDVQARLGLPFFVSIPLMNGNGGSRALKNVKKMALLPGKTEKAGERATAGPQPAPLTNGHLALWEKSHGLEPFYETLRDRLMTFFEMINLTHKPKLVAVTSCREGAGVTSTAAGLASSLSETGDGNVLLVNMNVRDGEAHHFYKGKLNCGLDDVFEKGTPENAFVQGRLYVAKELPEDDRLPRVLPKRFSHLLPKMKASDFDYIIFDMPPVSQISITPRLARFMDMVLLVVESEKTDRDVAARAAATLSEGKTNVGIVLNKNRDYGPRRLHHDI
jgi:uncharacterized protein involved in exopolysaccharide biosynthesis/Mrp family chromosome partitioning ATPase